MNESVKDTAFQKPFLLLIIAAAVCFIMFKLLLVPLFDQISRQSQQYDLLQKELRLYREFAAVHQDYEAFLQQRSKRLEQLRVRLPEQIMFSEQLKKWQQQAQECGVIISDVKLLPEQGSDNKQIKIQPVRVSFTGSYYSVLRFLRELKKSDNFVNINQVNIIGNENKGSIKFTALFNIYLYCGEK